MNAPALQPDESSGRPEASPFLPTVTVIVPVHENRKGITRLLRALADQTVPSTAFEVIVADDASRDGTPEVVEALGLARVVRLERNGGSYTARNAALEQASGEVIAFTDADCLPAPEWVEQGRAAFADGGDLVAGHIEIDLGATPNATALVDFARSLDQERAATREDFGATANLWVHRRVFEVVGRFNDRLISGGDTEFGQRAVTAGFKLEYAPRVIVAHDPRSHYRELAKKARRLGYGAAQHRLHAEGELSRRALIWARPGAYLPHRGAIYGAERLERSGIAPSRLTRAQMRLIEYLFVQLPLAAGSFAGWRAERRARRRAGSG